MATLVSIIIPSYNSARFLPDALESCLAQTYTPLEIMVVDDGSTDNTRQVVEQYSQVKYVYQPNQGVSAARNTGIQHSTGAFLQFLDADDMLLPTKIARCMEVFHQFPETGLVYTGYERRTPDMKNVITADKPIDTPEGHVLHRLLNHTSSFFGVHCPLTRREPLLAVGGFDTQLSVVADWNLWVRLAAQGVIFRAIPEPLVWYRHTPQSMSKQQIALSRDRLWAMENLRGMALPPDIDLEEKIAERHHTLAFRLWQHQRYREARDHWRQAIQLTPQGRWMRRGLLAMTYLMSADRAERMLKIINR